MNVVGTDEGAGLLAEVDGLIGGIGADDGIAGCDDGDDDGFGIG